MDVTKVIIAVGVGVLLMFLAALVLGAVIRHGSGERRPHEEQGFDDLP